MGMPRTRSIRIALSPDDDLVAAWLRFAAEAYPGSSLSAVVVEALGLQLGMAPDDAAGITIRQAAWRAQANRARRALGRALQAARAEFEAGLTYED